MKVFISYSRVDKDFASKLADDLIQHQFDIWIDVRNIPPGRDWAEEIQNGLEISDIMLLIYSPTAADSDNVKDEWRYFLSKRKPILTIAEDSTEPPYQLQRRQFITRSHDYKRDLEQIVAGLEALANELDQSIVPKPSSNSNINKPIIDVQQANSTPPHVKRRLFLNWVMVIGVVGLIGISGVLVSSLLLKAQPTPTPQPTVIAAQATDTPSITASASVSPSVTSTAFITSTDQPTVTATWTVTETSTATFSPTPPPSQTLTQTLSPTPIPPTATQPPTIVNVPLVSASSTPSPLVPTRTMTTAASATAPPRLASSTTLPPTLTAVPSATQVAAISGGFPCDAMIIDDAATRMSIVRSEPYSDSSVIGFVRPNDAVRIVDKKPEGTKIIWYQIAYGDAVPLGWVRYDYVVLSAACPK